MEPSSRGGAGSITHLGLRFRRGVFEAICPRAGSLYVAAASLFADGTKTDRPVRLFRSLHDARKWLQDLPR